MSFRFVHPKTFNPLGLFGVFFMLFASAMLAVVLLVLFTARQ